MKTIPFSHVRKYYESHQPNGHWFDAGSMRFFKTSLPKVAYATSDGVLFVTTEQNAERKAKYTVRRQNTDGRIETVGEFQQFPSADAALAEIRSLDQLLKAQP